MANLELQESGLDTLAALKAELSESKDELKVKSKGLENLDLQERTKEKVQKDFTINGIRGFFPKVEFSTERNKVPRLYIHKKNKSYALLYPVTVDGTVHYVRTFLNVFSGEGKENMEIGDTFVSVDGKWIKQKGRSFTIEGRTNTISLYDEAVAEAAKAKARAEALERLKKLKLSDIFEVEQGDKYFDHLAIQGVGDMKKYFTISELLDKALDKDIDTEKSTDLIFEAKYVVLTDLPSSNDGTGLYKDLPKVLPLKIDATTGSVISTHVTTPKLFGFSRSYVKASSGKLVETKKSKEYREKIVKQQKEKIKSMISKSVRGNVVPKTTEVSDIDVNGNYRVDFDISATFIKSSGKKIDTIQKQHFEVRFADPQKVDSIQAVSARFDIKDPIADTPKKLGKDKYGYFEVDIINGSDNKPESFNIVVDQTKEKEVLEEKIIIEGLDKVLDDNVFYQKVDGLKGESIYTFIDAQSGEKYHTLLEGVNTKTNGKRLENPAKIDIFPFGDIERDRRIGRKNMNDYMSAFKKDNKELISGLMDPGGFYKFSDGSIDAVISEYNKPLSKKVYKIYDNAEESHYFTAEKDGNVITFKEDKSIEKYISEQKKALESRFISIEKVYTAERVAQKTLLATEFERRAVTGVHNLGLYDGDIIMNTNQNATILNENYNLSKVQYIARIWYSGTKTENPVWSPSFSGYENVTGYEWIGNLYFDSKGKYDTKENDKMYKDASTKPVIDGLIGEIDVGKGGVIKFFKEAIVKGKKSDNKVEESTTIEGPTE